MSKRIAPSAVKAQALAALLQGHTEVESGEEWLSTLVQRATERVRQDALGREQTALLGRHRYERRGPSSGYRNGYVEEISLCWQGETQVYAKQPRGATVITYRHYLPELARKPQALRQVAPALLPELGEPYQTLWTVLAKTHGEREAARVVAKLLAAIVAHGEGDVTTALTQVMQSERADLHVVRKRLEAVPLPTRIAVPEQLAGYEVEAGKASAYDFLLTGGLL